MKRIHLFEFEDFPWFPKVWRNLVTDYLRFVVSRFELYGPIISLLKNVMQKTNCRRIVDLGSGSSGPMDFILRKMTAGENNSIEVILTDKFPNLSALERIKVSSPANIEFLEIPVDARRVPESLTGFRTLFNAFHHFKPQDARSILRDAEQKREGIGVFELAGRAPFTLLLIMLMPLFVLLLTPLIRPFTWQRLLYTYLVPVVPIIAVWDGMVSNLRVYSPKQLRELISDVHDPTYHWDIGKIRSPIGTNITYLIGYTLRGEGMSHHEARTQAAG